MPRSKHAVIEPETGVPKHRPSRHGTWGGHRKVGQRKRPPTLVTARTDLISLAVRWILPWSLGTYPGHQRGILAILARPITWKAIEHWKAGRRRPAAWACRALQSYIRTRCEVGLRLADELENLAVEGDRLDALYRLHRDEHLSRTGKPIYLAPDD